MWKVITPPVEPLTLAMAKGWARFDPDPHPLDSIISTVLIPAARRACEDHCGRSFGVQTLALTLDAFPDGEIRLPRPPAVSVNSIVYVAPDGTTRTVTDYFVDATSEPGWLFPAYGTTWPATRDQVNAITVTFTAGSDDVPAPVLHAMALQVTAGIENPSEVTDRQTYALARGVEALLQPYVVYAGRVPQLRS